MKKILNRITKAVMMLALPLGGAGMTSCSDFLQVEPQDIITIDHFWNEQSDVESIIAGCYLQLSEGNCLSRMFVWGEFRSENITSYGSTIDKDRSLERLLKEDIAANNAYTTWTDFYSVINRCNSVIKFAPDVQKNDPAYSESELNAHIAEVTALRSLCYFYLIRTFRDVPYNAETYLDDSQQLAIPADSFSDILDRLIVSLVEVEPNAIVEYPRTSGLGRYSNTGRITKCAIQALLCELYLWKGDYDKCIHYANEVLNRKYQLAMEDDATTDYSDYNGYPLLPCYDKSSNTFGYAFNEIFVAGNSSESIFELNFDKRNASGTSNVPVSNYYGNDNVSPFCNASEYISTDISANTPVVFSNKYDGRAYENIRYSGNGDPEGINKYTCESDIELYASLAENGRYSSSDWGVMYGTFGANNDSRNKSNFIVYRLTDIMLLKAEAYALKTREDATQWEDKDREYRDSAFILVDAVNKRSLYFTDLNDSKAASYMLSAKDYISQLGILNLVYEERERELMFEGKRWFDLVRRSRREGNTEYMRSKVKEKSPESASIIESLLQKMDRMYWPYNLDETKVNTLLHQNSAFSSGEDSNYEKTSK